MSNREMREPTFLILTALARNQHHGYSLLTETKKLSGGRVSLQPGSLYTTLDRLKEEGMVQAAGQEVVDGRLRQYYTLTDHGASALEVELGRLEANVDVARANLRARAAGGLA